MEQLRQAEREDERWALQKDIAYAIKDMSVEELRRVDWYICRITKPSYDRARIASNLTNKEDVQ